MTRPELVPANLPTLPTAQMLARLSAEPGRCEMTVDATSPWVAGVIVRTPRMWLALHAVSAGEAQIIAAPRVAGLQGSGDAQLQALLANAAPQDDGSYRAVPPPAVEEAAPPPLDVPLPPARTGARAGVDVPLLVVWGLFAALAVMTMGSWMVALAALVLTVAILLALLGWPAAGARAGSSGSLRTAALATGGFGLAALILAVSTAAAPLILLLALVSAVTGTAARMGERRSAPRTAAPQKQSAASEASPQALPAPQVQLIDLTRTRLLEHLQEAERSGNPRDVFEARQALEVHLPEVVGRWEALPSWRRRDDAPLRRTLEQLATASLPDTTTSELEWDATERFIEQKARARAVESGDLTPKREPLTPPARTPGMVQSDLTRSDSSEENS